MDYEPGAPVDEWSGDRGCGVQYLSQQAVGRLMCPRASTDEPGAPAGAARAPPGADGGRRPAGGRVYRTIGTYLGYALLNYREHYDLGHLLILGRVTTGAGGDVIIETARDVLAAEDPAAAEGIVFHMADENQKRHGQAMAAASLPQLR